VGHRQALNYFPSPVFIGVLSLRIRSSTVLKELGIDHWSWCDEPSEPEFSGVTFADIAPSLRHGGPRAKQILNKNLYRHQLDTIKALENGKNVILIAGTGSGKTEAWAIFTARNSVKTLVIYPNLALTADQVSRLKDYFPGRVARLDRPSLGGGGSRQGTVSRNALIILTNPAFLMADIKRWASNPARAYIPQIVGGLGLIVIDEFDYYGSHGASLLIAILELLMSAFPKTERPRIVVMTATLGSEEELAEALSKVNGRETVIVCGKPFRVRNCTYAVLGKDLELIRAMIMEQIKDVPPDIADIVLSKEKFEANAHLVVETLRRIGLKVPSPYFDPAELLANYTDDDVVTIVFTPSIRSASKLVRKIRSLLPPEKRDLVVEHHHLIRKDVRERIEELARANPPGVRVIVTVRTLLQGVDIGSVARVVHYGLPQDVREFLQRDGRKGRRREIGFTETIIIPISRWDRLIISGGKGSLKRYASLHLEKVYVLSNDYVKMFTGLTKVVSGIKPSAEELELLLKLGLVERSGSLMDYELTRKGIFVWQNLGFYEFGPPYNIPRYVIGKKGKRVVEGVSRKDLVEKFQPGMIDYSQEAIVLELIGDKHVSEVIEAQVTDIAKGSVTIPPYLDGALSKYAEYRRLLRERPDIVLDVSLGKIETSPKLSTTLPSRGFGLYVETPIDVVWTIESRKKYRIIRHGNRLIQLYETKSFEIGAPVRGKYMDFTYAVRAIIPGIDPRTLRIGAAALKVYLRLDREYAVSLREIETIVNDSFRPYEVTFFETQASGILKAINWARIGARIKDSEENPLWLPLLWLTDPEAAAEIILKGKTWNDVANTASQLAAAIAGGALMKILGKTVIIPRKPRRKVYVIEAEEINLRDGVGVAVVVLENGETRYNEYIRLGPTDPPTAVEKLIYGVLSEALFEDADVVATTDLKRFLSKRRLINLLDEMISESRLINPFKELGKCVGAAVTAEEVATIMGINTEDLAKLPRDADSLKKRVESLATLSYGAYLILDALSDSGKCSNG